MRVVLTRVKSASVVVADQVVGAIGDGLLLLVGIGHSDDEAVVAKMAAKILGLRLFTDGDKGFHKSVVDHGGSLLVVSQFTLYADVSKGRRPAFTSAARPEQAEPLVKVFENELRRSGLEVASGQFGADMKVESINDGPVTLVLE